MTRHGKNCTAGAVYTYHEKKKDTGNLPLLILYICVSWNVIKISHCATHFIFPAASGYGTQSLRLGKDAVKDFDCCCLSLQPCRDPVVTYEPHLHSEKCFNAEIVCMRLFNSALSGYTECYWTICVSAAWRLGLKCVCLYSLTAVKMDSCMKKKPSCNTSFTIKQTLPRKWRFEHFLQMYFALNMNPLHCFFLHTRF